MNEKAFKQVQQECFELSQRKNADYSRVVDNIGMFGVKGVIVRLHDKMTRLVNLGYFSDKPAAVSDEKLEDTLKDIANYSTIAILLLRNQWMKEDQNVKRSKRKKDR